MEDFVQDMGPITCSRIGVVAKAKADKVKLRLVHDLRRSGVNAKMRTHERVVLPRLSDACEDVLTLIDTVGAESWECVGLDFADAFKQLKVAPEERRHLGGKALDGYICYRTVLFGVRSGPLVWGRIAALLMRLTTAMHVHEKVRMQCFVDDPFIVIGGSKRERDVILLRIVLLWIALGTSYRGERATAADLLSGLEHS